MRPFILALPLLAAASLCAQQPAPIPVPTAKTPSTSESSPAFDVCPLSLFARQQGAPQTLWTISREDQREGVVHFDRKPAGYGVHVDLTEPGKPTPSSDRIDAITVQVFYIEAGSHVVLIGTPADHELPPHFRMTLSKSFRIDAGGDSLRHLYQANLLIGPASGIIRVHLVQIDYADGHRWKAPRPAACTAIPSPYLPVNASHP